MGSGYVKQALSDPWKKIKLMPNFFIFVLQPRVVPPNQYMIHKYPRAPCSRQSNDESLGVSQLHTTWQREKSPEASDGVNVERVSLYYMCQGSCRKQKA